MAIAGSGLVQAGRIGRAAGLGFASLALLCALALPAAPAERKHGLSAFGDLKYPADFKHFDYVNPDAPKGGRLATIGAGSVLTFNSFNMFIRKGDPAQGLEFLFDSLMARAQDEPDAVYGLVAHSAEVADDRRSVTFYLRLKLSKQPFRAIIPRANPHTNLTATIHHC